MSTPEKALAPLLNTGQILKRVKVDIILVRFIWKTHTHRSVLVRKMRERGVYDDQSFFGLQEVPCEGPGCSVWTEIGKEIIVVYLERYPKKKYLFCSIPCQRRHHVDHNSNQSYQGTASRRLRNEDLDTLDLNDLPKNE